MTRPAQYIAFIAIALFALGSSASAQDAGDTTSAPPASAADDGAEPGASAGPSGAETEAAEAATGAAPAAESEPPAPATAPTVLVPRTLCEARTIKAIEVSGNGRVSADDVRASMKLKAGVPCRDTEIAKDARALWDLGYFDDLIFRASANGNDLTLYVIVRERAAIGKITFEGDDKIEEEDIDEKVALEIGAILSENEVREQLTKIRDVYAEKGYFLAKVNYRLIAMPNNQVEVRYDIVEGPEVSVRRIQYIGNDHISDDDILAFQRTRPTGFFSFLSSNDAFKREFFDEDVLRLQALYYDRGYLNVQVAPPRVELTPDRQQIDITVPIKEGPRFRIGRLRVIEVGEDGSEVDPLGGRRVVREQVEAQPGDWFSRTKLTQGIEAITRHYRDASFAKATVEPETELDPDRRIVHITVAIHRGPPCHIERIDIQGNEKTRDRVVRREILLVEGDKYSQSLLEGSKERITALGYFESVTVAETDGKEPDGLVITYEVKERATGTFQVGAGFSSIEQFILTAQVDQQNLFGHGQSLSLQAQVSGIRQLIQLQFVEPYFLSTMWSLSLDATRTSNSFQTFTQKSTGGGAALGHPVFHRNLRLALRYGADVVEVSTNTGGVINGNAAGLTLQQRTPLAYQQLDGFTSSVRLSLTWDSRDNRLFPTKGIYTSVSAEAADPYIGSERTYARQRYFGRFYYPLFGGLVLRLNTEAGLITSRKRVGVPQYERFYLGGILSLRGFQLQSVGPFAGIPSSLDPTAPTTPYSLGGNIMLRSNLEVEIPILPSVGIKGVIFTDAGNTWNLERTKCQLPKDSSNDPARDACVFDPLALRTSWGFGVRWFSPMGPLRFEWGFPFDRRSFEDKVNFQFTIGQFF